jgi:hypothetical protein
VPDGLHRDGLHRLPCQTGFHPHQQHHPLLSLIVLLYI